MESTSSYDGPISPTGTPAGWYKDNSVAQQMRWWDGSRFTDATQPVPYFDTLIQIEKHAHSMASMLQIIVALQLLGIVAAILAAVIAS